MRTPLKVSTSVFRGSVARSLLPSAVFLIFAECRPQLKTRRSLLQAVCHWNVAGKARKNRKKTASSWRPCAGVQPRSSVQLVTYHACQRLWTTCCSASDHLKESHDTAVKAQGKATRTAWQSTISSGQLWLIRILQLLIAGECFWGEAEREW